MLDPEGKSSINKAVEVRRRILNKCINRKRELISQGYPFNGVLRYCALVEVWRDWICTLRTIVVCPGEMSNQNF